MTKPLKVLLVDDEPETLRLVRRILQTDGYDVSEAIDGQQALDLFAQEKPELILLDIIIPQVDGIEVLRRIRSVDKVTGIIMVSALTSEKLAVEAMLAGADDYVSKPFPLKEIRVRIQQIAAKARLRQDNLRLQHDLDLTTERLQKLLSQRAPASPAEAVTEDQSIPPQVEGETHHVTILYAEFALQGESIQENLHLYKSFSRSLASAANVIEQEGGILDQFMGDDILAIFKAAKRQEQALHALRAAQHLCSPSDNPEMQFSIGIHSGKALVGNVRMLQHTTYTAIGDTVQIAHRLQELAQPGDILLSRETFSLVSNQISAEAIGPCQMRGRTEPVEVYRVRSLSS